MSTGRVVQSALLGVLVLACGERDGDPIVRLDNDQQPPDIGAAGAAAGDYGDRGGAESDADQRGPTGLCGECLSSDECGDANDACIHHDGEHFCGRDCDDQHGCPDGYSCVELDHTQLFQCVPTNGCVSPPAPQPSLADIRQYLLARVNAERVGRGQPSFDASSCLDELAQDSAIDFARTDEPLGKFVKECDPIWPSCACDWNAEAEISVAHYALDWTSAIDRALGSSRDAQTTRFTQSLLDVAATDVGIGFWLSGDQAWIALSFR